MKNRSYKRITGIIKNVFDLRKWADFDRMKAFTQYLGQGFKKMFIPQKKTTGESFEQAVTQYQLNEKDLFIQQKALFRLSLLMSLIALFIFFYGVYQLIYGSITGMLLSLIVLMIALVLAFRYHFWHFQIKQRKLGCSFKEWLHQGLMGDK